MNDQKIKELKEAIKERDNYLLVSHHKYDPDALSSLIGMGLILENLGKNFSIYFDEEISADFNWLPLKQKIIKEIKNKNFDNVIILDCDRYQLVSPSLVSYIEKKFKILIDHHQSNRENCELNFVFKDCFSTTQILFYLAKALEIKNKDLFTVLLLGIMGDTVGLRIEFDDYSKLGELLEVIAEIVKEGGDYNLIKNSLFLNEWEEVKKISKLVLERVRVEDQKIFWVVIDENEDYKISVPNFFNSIKEAKISIVFEKSPDKIKIHFRSKGNIDVSILAQKYFNGGGHKKASGGYLEMDLDKAIEYTLKVVKEYLLQNENN